MIVVATEILRDAIWVFRIPINNETGSLCPRCGKWHWHVDFRPVGWSPRRDLEAFVDYPFGPRYIEYSRCEAPADFGGIVCRT